MAVARLQQNTVSTNFRTAIRSVPSQRGARSIAPPASFMGLSAATTINNIINRQPSIVGLTQEQTSFSRELGLLEPRPLVYWSSVEDRIGCL